MSATWTLKKHFAICETIKWSYASVRILKYRQEFLFYLFRFFSLKFILKKGLFHHLPSILGI